MLSKLSQKSRDAILKNWLQMVLESYPPDVAEFLQREQDQFANPVGSAIADGLAGALQELLGGMDAEKLSASLDEIVKIRAIQQFSPSQAVEFVFQLKRAIRQELGDEAADPLLQEELPEFESRIDRVALLAFDIYVRRREKIHDIRTRELRERSGRVLDRLKRIYGGVDLDLEEFGNGASDLERGSAR